MQIEPEIAAQRLKPLLTAAFPSADVDAIGPQTTADEVMGWDSMGHVSLIISIEETFGIRFEPEEVTGFSNVGELIALIARRATIA